MADGRHESLGAAQADVEIGGDRAPALVLIGPIGQVPLLGYVTLETLRLKVDPVTHQLEPGKFIEYLLN